MVVEALMRTELNRVVAEYFPILVGVTLLQRPTLVFSTDCGKEQRFDDMIHTALIDGDAIDKGRACVVVFPALLVEGEGRRGLNF